MHAPDGFLTVPRRRGHRHLSAGAVGVALRRSREQLGERAGAPGRPDGGVRVRGPDGQLPGGRRDDGPPARWRARRRPARPLGRHAGGRRRRDRAGAGLRRRRDHRARLQPAQHGGRDRASAGGRCSASVVASCRGTRDRGGHRGRRSPAFASVCSRPWPSASSGSSAPAPRPVRPGLRGHGRRPRADRDRRGRHHRADRGRGARRPSRPGHAAPPTSTLPRAPRRDCGPFAIGALAVSLRRRRRRGAVRRRRPRRAGTGRRGRPGFADVGARTTPSATRIFADYATAGSPTESTSLAIAGISGDPADPRRRRRARPRPSGAAAATATMPPAPAGV